MILDSMIHQVSLDTVRLKLVWLLLPVLLCLAAPSLLSLLLGVVVGLFGLGIRLWAAGYIDKLNKLTTHGPYAYTRNPLYLGTLVIGLGFAIAASKVSLVLVCLAFFYFVYLPKVRQEATELEKKFGDQYLGYAQMVRLILPAVKPYRDSLSEGRSCCFSLRRYLLNREWEALLTASFVFGLLFLKFFFWK